MESLNKKILIIDDNPEYVELLRSILSSRGYEVKDAHDGLDGLEKLKKYTPDLIILDINMPRMDGMEFYKRIRTRFGRTKYPVLVSTARQELGEMFKEISADGFLPKPFKIEELLNEVGLIIRGDRNPLVCLLAMPSHPKVQELQKMFLQERYRVSIIEDTSLLKEKLKNHIPQIIVMEFVQKSMDAVEMIQELRKGPPLSLVPIVVYSHSGFPGLREKALTAGADTFVENPSNFGEFFHAINLIAK